MNIPVINPRPTIVPARPTDRIRDRKESGERREKQPQDPQQKPNNKKDDGRPHLDEYA